MPKYHVDVKFEGWATGIEVDADDEDEAAEKAEAIALHAGVELEAVDWDIEVDD